MIASKTKTFNTAHGPAQFTVSQLPAMRAGKLLMRLGKTIGPAIASLASAMDVREGKDLDVSLDAMPASVAALFANLDGNELEYLTHELLDGATVTVNGQTVPVLQGFDLLMQGQIPAWFQLLWFALTVNYGNFFDALGGLGPGSTMAKAAKAARSITCSGPQSG